MWESINFARKEFACKCGCGMDTVDYELLTGLEQLRMKLSGFLGAAVVRIRVVSGNRCPKRNVDVGGEKNSYHMKSRAADIQVDQLADGEWHGIAPKIVADLAEDLEFGGVGRYETFTHVDTRSLKARWGHN